MMDNKNLKDQIEQMKILLFEKNDNIKKLEDKVFQLENQMKTTEINNQKLSQELLMKKDDIS